MIREITTALEGMHSITLDEMKSIRLMDRIDSKYVAPVSLLPELLKRMTPYFRVQTQNGIILADYSTQYLDTKDLQMYQMHQNGKLNRQKVRIRSYVDNAHSYLEIKNKNNKGRTSKIRVQVPVASVASVYDLSNEITFLQENSLFPVETLVPSLSNRFNRITCVNNRKTERITIDLGLTFRNEITGKETCFDDLVILELKQDGWQHSDFRDILLDLRIKQTPFSKYCMGTVVTNEFVKYNRFKSRLTRINKLID